MSTTGVSTTIRSDGGKSVEETLKQVAEVQSQLEKSYERWEDLEKLRNS